MSDQTIAANIDAKIVKEIEQIAKQEGLSVESLVAEALGDLITKKQKDKPRSHVMSAYQDSHKDFAPLYKKLAQ